MKKALSLALTLIMCLGLTVPAFAAVPLDQATGEDMLKTFTLMRNGTVDETVGTFVDETATGYSIVIGIPEEYGKPTKIEYAVFDEEDSWTITNTGNKDYTVSGNTDYEICIYMRTFRMDSDLSMGTPDIVFSCGDPVNDYWTDKGTFLYGALEGNDEYGNIISLKAGESATIPAKAFVGEYSNLLDGYGPIYEMEIATFYNGTVTEEHSFEEARYTKFYFRVNNGKTKEIKDSMNEPVNQPENPTEPTTPAYQVSNWAKDRVALAVETGLAADSLGNDYRVNITRAQFAATAVKLYEAMSGEKVEATGESSFTDTTDPVILQAADMGFVSGVGGGKFSPDALVTREQAAVMLSSVFTKLGGEIPAVESTTFADDGDVAGWARNAVAFMNSNEIVTGVGNNSFAPKGNASIEQALLIALKMFETLK